MIGFGGQLSPGKSGAPDPVLIAELHADLLLVVGESARKSFVSLTGIHQLRATSR